MTDHLIVRAFLHGGRYDRTMMSALPTGPLSGHNGDTLTLNFEGENYAGDLPEDIDPDERDLIHLYVCEEVPDTLPDWMVSAEQPAPTLEAQRRLHPSASHWTPAEVDGLIADANTFRDRSGEPWADAQLSNLMRAMFVCRMEGCDGQLDEVTEGHWCCQTCGTLDIEQGTPSTDSTRSAGTVSGDGRHEQAKAPRRANNDRRRARHCRRQLPPVAGQGD